MGRTTVTWQVPPAAPDGLHEVVFTAVDEASPAVVNQAITKYYFLGGR